MSPSDFVTKYGSALVSLQNETGLPARAVGAQAALESGWGESSLAAQYNNFFGIKDFGGSSPLYSSVTLPTREWSETQGWYTIQAAFRSYATAEDCFLDYADFIFDNSRYIPALKVRNSAVSYLYALQAAGYATAPNYASEIIAVMNSANFPDIPYNPATILPKYLIDLPVLS